MKRQKRSPAQIFFDHAYGFFCRSRAGVKYVEGEGARDACQVRDGGRTARARRSCMDRYGFRPVFIRVKCDRFVRGCNHHTAFPSPVALRDWHGVCPQQLDEGVNTFVSRAMAV
jgi:hypothetical protein